MRNTTPPPESLFLKETEGQDTHHQMRFEELIWTKQISEQSVMEKNSFLQKEFGEPALRPMSDMRGNLISPITPYFLKTWEEEVPRSTVHEPR